MEGSAEINSVVQFLNQVDRDVTLAINSWHCSLSDGFWYIMSHVQLWYILYLLIVVLIIARLGWKKGLVAIGCCILFVFVCDQLGNFVKDTVCRLRPLHDPDMMARGLHIFEKPDETEIMTTVKA